MMYMTFSPRERLEDIDFTRIAAQKQAQRAFGKQYYLYMDYAFSIWIMLWHVDPRFLETQIDLFWREFVNVAPSTTAWRSAARNEAWMTFSVQQTSVARSAELGQ